MSDLLDKVSVEIIEVQLRKEPIKYLCQSKSLLLWLAIKMYSETNCLGIYFSWLSLSTQWVRKRTAMSRKCGVVAIASCNRVSHHGWICVGGIRKSSACKRCWVSRYCTLCFQSWWGFWKCHPIAPEKDSGLYFLILGFVQESKQLTEQ